MSEAGIPGVLPEPRVLWVGSGVIDPQSEYTDLAMPDGRRVRVPTELLLFVDAPAPQQTLSVDDGTAEDAGFVLPVIEEQLVMSKRVVETGKVRLRKTVESVEQQIDELLTMRSFEVNRIVLNQHVKEAPPVRREGATTIYPVVEEELVLTRQLLLKEEIHVTLRETREPFRQTVSLQRERIEVERLGPTKPQDR